MIGPTLTFRLGPMPLRLGLVDFLVAAVAAAGVLDQRDSDAEPSWLIFLVALVATLAFFASAVAMEQLRLWLLQQRLAPGAGPLTLAGVFHVTVDEVDSSAAALWALAAGLLSDAMLAMSGALLVVGLKDRPALAPEAGVVLGMALIGMAAARLLPIVCVEGGRPLRALMAVLFEDESDRIAAALSGFIAGVVGLGAFGLVVQTEERSYWGLALIFVGLDLLIGSYWMLRQIEWVRYAGTTRLGLLGAPPYASLSAEETIHDLFTVLRVEGSRAVVTIVDPIGAPIGIVSARQVRRRGSLMLGNPRLDLIMEPVDRLPRFSTDLSILDAATALGTTGNELGIVDRENGLPRIVTLHELLNRR